MVLAPSVSPWLVALLTLLLASACEETIALGSECPPLGKECISVRRDEKPEPQAREDAATDSPDASLADAGSSPLDAGTPPSFPAISNGTFEITAGNAEGGRLSTFGAQSQPWLSCSWLLGGPGVYRLADLRPNPVGAPLPGEQLEPTDGDSLLSAPLDGSALTQTLAEPLRSGTRYAFAIDLAATLEGTGIYLEVQGGFGCVGLETLATTTSVTVGSFATHCVELEPLINHTDIMLVARSDSASAGARLFMDNIRPVTACP